jgi:hypothetical protein
MFVTLGSYVKQILDCEASRDLREPGMRPNAKLTHDSLLNVFHTIPLKKGFKKHRPDFSDFYLDVNYRAKAKAKKVDNAHLDPDLDDVIGVAEPPPGVDVESAEPGLYDQVAEVNRQIKELQDRRKRLVAGRR